MRYFPRQPTLFFILCTLAVSAYSEFSVDQNVLAFVQQKYGEEAHKRVLDWREIVVRDREAAKKTDRAKLVATNDYFNRIRWLSDLEHWGKEDYWATPLETLATNGGDCEDFSIGKYFSLLGARLDPSKLRITYVKSLSFNQAHMVLAYYQTPSAEPLILDNINKTVLPASQRQDLMPIYSFNGDSIWLAKDRGRQLKGSSQKSLPKWKELNERMMGE